MTKNVSKFDRKSVNIRSEIGLEKVWLKNRQKYEQIDWKIIIHTQNYEYRKSGIFGFFIQLVFFIQNTTYAEKADFLYFLPKIG